MRRFGSAFLVAAVLLAGCETTDQFLDSADRALDVAYSGSAQALVKVAKSKDPEAAVKEGLKRRGDVYANNPRTLIADVRAVKRDYDNLMSLLRGKVGKTWGKKEIRVPAQKRYIKYTQNYKSRAIVDFDRGEVTVETLDERDANASLKNAVVTTLLTPNDPRAVDLFSDSAVILTSDKEPYLLGLVVDQENRPIAGPEEAERFADYLLHSHRETRAIDAEGGRKNAVYVRFAMVRNFEHKQAEKYGDLVSKYAGQYKISPSLVYAIIKTESNFNPFAISSAPAYGLMQLVPASGGREAYRRAKGQDTVPTKQYLLDAQNNIELGTAYLSVLTYDQLERVGDPIAREYCVISAYNTGPGNVWKTFSRDQVEAVNTINSMQAAHVYEKLRVSLPYEETRHYLVKVTQSRREFVTRAE